MVFRADRLGLPFRDRLAKAGRAEFRIARKLTAIAIVNMDYPQYLIDVLLFSSAVGSCVAGIVCGWQLRTGKLKDEITPARFSGDTSTEVPFMACHRPLSSVYGAPSKTDSPDKILEVASRLILLVNRISNDDLAADEKVTNAQYSGPLGQELPSIGFILSAVKRLVVENESMQVELRAASALLDDQLRRIESVERQSITDALTQIGNRGAFDLELANWNGQASGFLALVDIDEFKGINDEHGRQAGDKILRAIADLLTSQSNDTYSVSRYGGGVFGLVFHNQSIENACETCETLRRQIAELEIVANLKKIHVTCSLGVTRMVAGEPLSEWLQRADDALYMSKFTGRNCGHCIDSQLLGERQKPYRLSDCIETAPRPHAIKINAGVKPQLKNYQAQPLITDEIPDAESLGESYRDLLARLGKTRVNLSIIALSIAEPHLPVLRNGVTTSVTRMAQLYKVSQGFCRLVDRVGYKDEQTLLICLPGIGPDALRERTCTLASIAKVHLYVPLSEIAIGSATAQLGDTFECLLRRACGEMSAVV